MCPPLSTHGNSHFSLYSRRELSSGNNGPQPNKKTPYYIAMFAFPYVVRTNLTTRGFMYPSLRQFDYFRAGSGECHERRTPRTMCPLFLAHMQNGEGARPQSVSSERIKRRVMMLYGFWVMMAARVYLHTDESVRLMIAALCTGFMGGHDAMHFRRRTHITGTIKVCTHYFDLIYNLGADKLIVTTQTGEPLVWYTMMLRMQTNKTVVASPPPQHTRTRTRDKAEE